jgi:hypothetical protein
MWEPLNTDDKEVENTKQKQQQQQQQSSCNPHFLQFSIFRTCGENGICRACRICSNIFFGSESAISGKVVIAAFA